jgi:8-oxo-dGTP diphosphatase
MTTPCATTAAKREYVLGLLFSSDGSSVVLIRKNRPTWQAGLLNGVGGKIERGETPIGAMVREFTEETGVSTSATAWRPFCEMTGDDFAIYGFVARDTAAWAEARTKEDEPIVKLHPSEVADWPCVSNLPWLVALALDENGGRAFYATVNYSPITITPAAIGGKMAANG